VKNYPLNAATRFGIQLAHQGVPLNKVFWAVCIARGICQGIYSKGACWKTVGSGRVMMLRSLDRFLTVPSTLRSLAIRSRQTLAA
jgi:hypothetical protein